MTNSNIIRYLFLCAEGRMRSPTAVDAARQLAAKKGLLIEAECGGINYLQQATVPHLLLRYDRFVVMERYMADMLIAFGVEKRK